MGTYTKNLKLETPNYTDNADIPALAKKNNEIIDSEMIKRANGLDYNEQTGVLQLTGNNSKVGSPIQIKNNLPVTSMASGTELKVNNYKQLIKFTKEGKTEQKTYTGKNLLNYVDNLQSISGLTNTLNPDGSITTAGKPTADYTRIVKNYDITNFLEDKQVYTISQEKLNRKVFIQISAKKKDGTYTYYDSSAGKLSFTVDKSLYTNYSIVIQTPTMSVWGDSSLTITNKYMLCKGTDTADSSFEPYVGKQPSPNPDYPQEIVNVKGVENLLNIPDGTYTDNGVTAVAKDGVVTINGTATANSFISIPFNYTFLANINYTLSANNTLAMGGENYIRFNYGATVYFPCRFSLEKSKFTNNFNENTIVNAFTIRTEIGKTYNNFVIKPQLEEGTIAHTFVLPGSNYLLLNNKSNNLANIKDIKIGKNWINVSDSARASILNISVKPNTLYTLDSNININSHLTTIRVVQFDKLGSITHLGIKSGKFVTDNNVNYVSIEILADMTFSKDMLKNVWISLVEGDVAPNIPYFSHDILIDLKGNNLCSNKDKTIKDELVIENGRAKIIKNYDEAVLDGSGNWERYTCFDVTKYRFAYISLKNLIKKAIAENTITPIQSNRYLASDAEKNYEMVQGIAVDNAGTILIYDNNHNESTPDEWKTCLKSLYDSGNPVKVQYQLAEPKVIDLGEVDFDLIENSTLTCEEESDMQIDYLTIDSNIFVQDSLDGNSNQKAPSIDAIKKYFGKKVYDKDANGWIKIEFIDHVEYVYRNIKTYKFNTGWGTVEHIQYPVGMESLGDRILTCSVTCEDSVVHLSAGARPTDNNIAIRYENHYNAQTGDANCIYSFRILEYK